VGEERIVRDLKGIFHSACLSAKDKKQFSQRPQPVRLIVLKFQSEQAVTSSGKVVSGYYDQSQNLRRTGAAPDNNQQTLGSLADQQRK